MLMRMMMAVKWWENEKKIRNIWDNGYHILATIFFLLEFTFWCKQTDSDRKKTGKNKQRMAVVIMSQRLVQSVYFSSMCFCVFCVSNGDNDDGHQKCE